jgi:catechol 2,3-dioxygenase-like lactoylglutathione lyase family enzyme
VTAMEITIQSNFLPHDDPDASLRFYRDTLGFEVRNDVGHDGMRWITIGPADQPMSADPGSRARRDAEIGSVRQRRPPRDRRAAAGAG